MKSPFVYTPEEWIAHRKYFSDLSEEGLTTDTQERAAKYFEQQYPDPQERRYKSDRFVLSQIFQLKHAAEFGAHGFGLESRGDLHASHYISHALYRYYANAPDEVVYGNPPPIEHILKLARESEEREKTLRDRGLQ